VGRVSTVGAGAPAGAPVVALRVTVRVPDLDAFITRYSRHIVGDRIFIFSKAQQPVGTQLRFHLQLPDGEPLLSGRGTVMRVQPEGGDARHPPGMELKFEPLDERSRTLVEFMVATRQGATQAVAAEAPPIVRAVVPPPIPVPPPSVAPPPPETSPLASATSTSPPVEPPTDVLPSDVPVDAPAKPTPVARPPSVSLEVGWKQEATEVPANPFAEVSAGAIEYFVEWSFEQSIGPRAMPQAQFSDVPMALPDKSAHPLLARGSRRAVLLAGAGLFAAGLVVGGVTVALLERAPRSASPALASVAPPSPSTATTTTATAPSTQPQPRSPATPSAAREAELIVISHPAGATVTVDGEAAGQTPLTTHVSPGEHAITVAKERYAPASSKVDAPGKLALDLRRPPATLHVTSTPPAADVLIAGERRGRTPLDVKLPGFESYDVRVALAGTKPWRKTVYLGRASNRVDAALASLNKRR
jgi:hypothetical protein